MNLGHQDASVFLTDFSGNQRERMNADADGPWSFLGKMHPRIELRGEVQKAEADVPRQEPHAETREN